jgi:hypothetical protein
LAELQVATVRAGWVVALHRLREFQHMQTAEMQEKDVKEMLDQLIAWSGALTGAVLFLTSDDTAFITDTLN